jgi:putative membrane protein
MMWGWGYGDPGLWGIVGLVVMALFWALVITLIVLGIRWLVRVDHGSRLGGPGASGWTRPDDPLEILRQRYARGEIDDEEYERRRKLLSGG